MKRWLSMVIGAAWLLGASVFAANSDITVSDLELRGKIDGENIVFTLSFDVKPHGRNLSVPLVVGDVAYLDGKFPKGSELVRKGDKYVLKLGSGGFWSGDKQSVSFVFASRALRQEEWRHTTFSIPAASIRRLSVVCDRDDLEVRFPGALNVERQKNKDNQTEVTAFLGITDSFQVRWKPEVKKLDAELVVSCEANTIATASVGAMRLDSVYTYRVIQGSLRELKLDLPDVSVTQVTGDDIQGWRIDRTDPANPSLLVTLSRPKETLYRLRVESERVLPPFPAKSTLPVLSPIGVIRSSGFLLVGTDSAIKLQIAKASGLTQVDQAAFPEVALNDRDGSHRDAPARSLYAYQYANTPYTLDINADDIITTFTVDNRLVLTLSDNELTLDASVEIDVKDAPAREIYIETDHDAEWTVTSVTGQHVSEADTDVREEKNKRLIYVPFRQAVSGMALINIRMERSLKRNSTTFEAPRFSVQNAKSERGYLVVAAERGIRLRTSTSSELREVHTGSAPMQVNGAQQAFRFKSGDWSLTMAVERTQPAIDTEVFHLVSLGEGVMYCSAAITYHISGAPVQEFQVHVPADIETVEFTGADIEGWHREGETCRVRLQTKVIGDYTLLATFDKQFDYAGAVIEAGSIETIDTDSEVGYLALASSASLDLTEAATPPSSIIRIDRDEIPSAYASPVNDPIIKSYKYVKNPHVVSLRIKPFDTEPLLGQIADYVKIDTELGRKGGAISTATYYIKNASRQYLMVKLPEGVDLWSIKIVDENGNKTDVLSQDKGDELLIPVNRPEDPNTAIAVELIYAQSLGELGFWHSGVKGLRLKAPTLSGTHATFAGWRVTVPEGMTLGAMNGNMTPQKAVRHYRFDGVLIKVGRIGKAIISGRYSIAQALMSGIGGSRSMEFTRTVNLSGERPLTLSLTVVPGWIGLAGSARYLVVSAAIGLALLFAGLLIFKRRAIMALGITVAAFGAAHCAAGRSALALLVWAILVGLFLRYGLKAIIRFVRKFVRGTIRALVSVISFAWRVIVRVASGLYALLVRGWRAFRAAREQAYLRKLELRRAEQAVPDIPPFETEPSTPPESCGGYVLLRGLLPLAAALLLMLGGLAAVADGVKQGPPMELPQNENVPLMDKVEVSVVGPAVNRDVEQSADVDLALVFKAEEAGSFIVLPAGSVLTDYELNSRHLSISSDAQGYLLKINRSGDYRVQLKFRTPVTEVDGRWVVNVPLMENMRNQLKITLPETGMDIRAEGAVLFRSEENEAGTWAEAVFGPVRVATVSWRPRVRKTMLEDVVFFSEVNSFASLGGGVIDLTHFVRYQIAQGELKALKLLVPENMSVTAVTAPGLATWSYDPETHLLEAILEQAVTGDFTLVVQTQVASDGLPYAATLGALQVQDNARQRGALAIAASETVQIRIDDSDGVNPMNIEDFAPEVVKAALSKAHMDRITIRRALRYNQPALVSVPVHAEQVLPELRVREEGALSIADERIVLSTKLMLNVTKSGVFSVSIGIPAEFDVETLSGKDVSHWDEMSAEVFARSGIGGGRGVTVHFNRRVDDATEINLVVAQMEKGIEAQITVPRVYVADARKHSGRLTVSGERGVRLMVESHRGVDIKKASEVGITRTGVLVFDILRPAWNILLKTDVMEPLIKPEVLQWVDLTEGMLKCQAFVNYQIENAGVKTFFLQSPLPNVALAITGRHIARVSEVDKEQGLWKIELHGKVENNFSMTVGFQVPFNHEERRVKVLPLKTVDTESQRGYLVVTCGGRVQVVPDEGLEGLKVEDARTIPATFGAGDLSDAILCYRTVRSDYELPLSVVRHESADVLPASIKQVRMTSIVSNNRKLLTRLNLQLAVGDLRFLRMALPNADDSLWTVLVNGREVSTSRDKDLYCIPLEEQEGQGDSSVEVVYAGSMHGSGILGEQKAVAPSFEGLPLKDIEWSLYVLPQANYYGFGGTMDLVRDTWATRVFDSDHYMAYNRKQREVTLQKARDVLSAGEQMAQSGRQKEAKKAFQQALSYSMGQEDLNEDARVQLRNLTKQQFKIGLVNRRNAVRFRKNMIDEREAQQMEEFQGGNFTPEYAHQIEEQLSELDNDALDVVAEKMIDQQAAAAGVVKAIRIAMPEHGKELRFSRALQVDPEGELSVSFRVSHGRLIQWLNALWPMLVIFAITWALLASMRQRAVAA